MPLSLGDSHHGFRVLGTTPEYFEHYKFRHGQGSSSPQEALQGPLDAVLGADVAGRSATGRRSDHRRPRPGLVSFIQHADQPFWVAASSRSTGTPVDRTVHVSLEAIEAIHGDRQSGMPVPGEKASAEQTRQTDLEPKAITASLVGLKSKLATFQVQRVMNQ